jgi:dihydrofolate reductase
MSIVTVDLALSLDGFTAGPDQTLENPFGGDGVAERMSSWMFEHGDESADEIAAITDAGAFIMGRNMFSPGRGEWDPDWRGWWGEEPPYHTPVFVLTHHPREPLPMEGGTTFTFVTDGIESAMAQARQAAGGRNISIAGGAATINAYLAAGLIGELRLHVVPITLGAGERLFDGVPPLTLEPVSARGTAHVTHLTYRLAH